MQGRSMRYPPATRSGLGMSSTRPVRVRCPPFSRRFSTAPASRTPSATLSASAGTATPLPPSPAASRRVTTAYPTRCGSRHGSSSHPAGQRGTCLLQALRPQLKQKKTPVGTPTGVLSCHPPSSSSFVSMSAGAQPRTVLPTLKSSNSTSYCSCVRLGYIL